MKVSLDHEGCISCGLCVGSCPSVFEFADDERAVVIRQPDQSEYDDVRACAEGCPVSVISVEE
ncbi:MAG: ferredoxin [Oscillospiraceae bacterium]